MKVDLHLYPTLNVELKESIGFSAKNLLFFYNRNRKTKGQIVEEERELIPKEIGESPIELNDRKGYWSATHDNLVIRQEIHLENPKHLFGESGLTSDYASLGLAVLWSSPEALQKGSIDIGTLTKDTLNFEKRIELKFEPQQIKNNLLYRIVIYVKNPPVNDTFFANRSGMILGTLYSEEIILEGDASSFPIVSIEDENAPLWSLYCNWGSISDSFEESIRLRLNKKHKNYNLLNVESNRYNAHLFKQILISVVVQILHKAVEQNEISMVEEMDDLEVGTVGYLIKYYLETYSVDYTSLSTIYDSINKQIWG